ncbi:MAG TPA: c-type cytochrome [Pedobacter sp.]|uniref:c-type cytochrome n=1 Tax=Pedobacter sp. TaxID=1411316 RepID=UPI002BF92883|nr:c-type cytochrome [Pedobacter sp.]HMI05019.1 c-type cytochrome [Pedobacter sp.]
MNLKSQIIKNINTIRYFLTIAAGFCIVACNQNEEKKGPVKVVDYIKKIEGPSDTLSAPAVQKGKVLISYSDCYTCHTEDKRAKGPAFKDIAARYPVQQVYIDLLAQKIISGGFGIWGNPVMDPHPHVTTQDARLMVTYILSLKEK